MHRVDASDESFHSKTIMGYGMSEILLQLNVEIRFSETFERDLCIALNGRVNRFRFWFSPVLSQASSSA